MLIACKGFLYQDLLHSSSLWKKPLENPGAFSVALELFNKKHLSNYTIYAIIISEEWKNLDYFTHLCDHPLPFAGVEKGMVGYGRKTPLHTDCRR